MLQHSHLKIRTRQKYSQIYSKCQKQALTKSGASRQVEPRHLTKGGTSSDRTIQILFIYIQTFMYTYKYVHTHTSYAFANISNCIKKEFIFLFFMTEYISTIFLQYFSLMLYMFVYLVFTHNKCISNCERTEVFIIHLQSHHSVQKPRFWEIYETSWNPHTITISYNHRV